MKLVFLRFYMPGMELDVALDIASQLGEEVLPRVRREVGRDSLLEPDA
jgi:hypothetical protein